MFDSEAIITGCILGDSRALAVVRPLLTAEDFQTELGRFVFTAAISLDDEGAILDPVLIKNRAAEQGHHLSDGALADAMMNVTASSNLPTHAQAMRDITLRAGIIATINDANGRLLLEEDPRSVYADLQGGLERVAERYCGAGLMDGAAAMNEYVDHRIAVDNGEKLAYIPTGFTSIDNLMGGGFAPQSLNILAARPGCGKTTVGLQIADKVAASGIPVLFISLEMPTIQLTARRLAVETSIPSNTILMHEMGDNEHCAIAAAMDKLSTRPLVISAGRQVRVGDIGVQARQVKNCGLIVVDYLGLLQYEPGKSIYEQVTKTSNALKRLACMLDIPILCLAQLNRELEGRKGPPRLSDLRDSGAIEQDADSVLLLHQLQAEKGAPTPLICTIAKNRHGPAGDDVEFAWAKRTGKLFPSRYEPALYAS